VLVNMIRLRQSVGRRPLGVSLLALALSVLVIGLLSVPAYSGPWVPLTFDWGVAAACGLALIIAVLAVLNLIRAERRGYSTTRTGLAVAALFFAFAPLILLALKLIRLYLNPE